MYGCKYPIVLFVDILYHLYLIFCINKLVFCGAMPCFLLDKCLVSFMSRHYWLTYPATYRDRIKPLLNQQMWLFGQDIVCPKGNLLYRYQFSHQRPAERGGSMYTLWDEGKQIVLWGWGIWYGQAETGAIFVNRFKAKPGFSTTSHLYQPIHVQKALPPMNYRFDAMAQVEVIRQMWGDLLHWLAKYERWILDECGPVWRKKALKPFPHACTELSSVDQLANEWMALAEQSHTLPIKSYEREALNLP